ncbi:MAG: cyclic pyranopterin monophosphate synthase MoaC [Flammeovirgaceae bacterium]
MKNKFSHIDSAGNPKMVDVSKKAVTVRTARAQAVIKLGKKITSQMKGNELITKKGPVFQTAIVAGVLAAKRTSDLIPFCHPIGVEDCQIKIEIKKLQAVITSITKVTSKTGVEMEALTACTVAALTVYDMCKALSHKMVIEEIKLLEKTGGKKDFLR